MLFQVDSQELICFVFICHTVIGSMGCPTLPRLVALFGLGVNLLIP